MEKNNVFFRFYDENTSLDYRIPVSCTYEEYEEWECEDVDNNDSIIFATESLTRVVHDTACEDLEDGTTLVGFTSYEADTEEKREFLLRTWKEQLVKLNWAKEEDKFFSVVYKER